MLTTIATPLNKMKTRKRDGNNYRPTNNSKNSNLFLSENHANLKQNGKKKIKSVHKDMQESIHSNDKLSPAMEITKNNQDVTQSVNKENQVLSAIKLKMANSAIISQSRNSSDEEGADIEDDTDDDSVTSIVTEMQTSWKWKKELKIW